MERLPESAFLLIGCARFVQTLDVQYLPICTERARHCQEGRHFLLYLLSERLQANTSSCCSDSFVSLKK